ncbi:MAG: zinc-ribbon domain containing protein [Polyangia bacterium]
MTFEDKTLTCVQCGEEFVFSAGEQEFFAQKNLNSPPKRCKECRKKNRRRGGKRGRQSEGGDYRSPAFEDSAPDHQKIRRGRRLPRGDGTENGNGRGRGRVKRRSSGRGGYRSPAFRDHDFNPSEEYRSPAFQHEQFSPEDEYRQPGFREFDQLNPEEEYRAPGFAEYRDDYKDERPMFQIVCAACGKETMVPFLPEEKERPMCQQCYAEFKASQQRREAEGVATEEDGEAHAEDTAAEEAESSSPSDSPAWDEEQ